MRARVLTPTTAAGTSMSTGDNNMAAGTSGNTTGKQPPLGTGQRFKNLQSQLSGKKGVYDPAGLAAFIGQRKYGASKMSSMAAKNRGGK